MSSRCHSAVSPTAKIAEADRAIRHFMLYSELLYVENVQSLLKRGKYSI